MNFNQQITDYIYYYPNIMDSKMCNNIINYFDKSARWKQSTFSNAYKNTGTSKVAMDEYWIGPPDSYYQDLKIVFSKVVSDYIISSPTIQSHNFTDFRLNRYCVGGFMKTHVDSIHHSHGQKQGYPHLTSLIFLNDNYDGGEFVLCNEPLKKEQGSAVVFPSNFMFPHQVKEVTKGKRYSVMVWIL